MSGNEPGSNPGGWGRTILLYTIILLVTLPQRVPNSRARTHKGSSMQHPYHSRPRRASPLAPAVHCTRLPQSAHSHNPTQRQSRIVPQRPTPTQSQSTHTTLHRTQQFLNTTPHTLSPQQQSTPKSVQRPHTPQDTIRTLIPRTSNLTPHILAGWVVPRW